MIGRLVFILFFLNLTFLSASAQVFEIVEEEEDSSAVIKSESLSEDTDLGPDSLYRGGVMIVSYKPKYYLSDADREIMEVSDETPDKTRAYLRFQLEQSLYLHLRRYFNCISLLLDTSQKAEEDLQVLHSVCQYYYEKPLIRGVQNLKKMREWKNRLTEADENADNSRMTPQSRTTRGDNKYLSVNINKPELLEELHDYYGVSRFLFINQFEIKTNYNICLDIANKIYQRQLLLHYSIVDKNGNHIAGNFTVADFPPSNNNKPEAIAGFTFPKAAALIRDELER